MEMETSSHVSMIILPPNILHDMLCCMCFFRHLPGAETQEILQ